MNENIPILMTEECWANTYFSVVRHTGQMQCWNRRYVVVDKHGRTVFETSIPPGEPADLIWDKMIPAYRKLGRDLFIELLKLRADEYIIQACVKLGIKTITDYRERRAEVKTLAEEMKDKALAEKEAKKRKEATE